jgi:hypothetical protein
MEIVSADTLVVKDNASGQERRLVLSRCAARPALARTSRPHPPALPHATAPPPHHTHTRPHPAPRPRSLRAPRMGTRDRPADPWALDGREFLRKKLIGREVAVAMEYNRKIPLSAAEVALNDGAQERVISCANVEIAGGEGEGRDGGGRRCGAGAGQVVA